MTGYSAGFNLPIETSKVQLGTFTPGGALPAGSSPAAATARLPTSGPLANLLVTGQSQKASGDGAVTTDTALPPGSVIYSFDLQLLPGASPGVVFDGSAADFKLPSGGLRNRAGMTVVTPDQVAVGKLEVTR
jgi:hypothetical protein